MQVSAASKLVPAAHAAQIRPSSRGNLLRQLLSANVDADLYGKELVRAVINVSMQGVSMRALEFALLSRLQCCASLHPGVCSCK